MNIEHAVPRLLAKDDACEGRVLAHDADAGVAGDEDQKAGLALGEPALRDRSSRPTTARTVGDAFITCVIERSTRPLVSLTAGFDDHPRCHARSNV